jgi:hypothetical protein
MIEYTICRNCGRTINPAFGEDHPGDHDGAEGTSDDPLAPGDWDNVCAECCYNKGVRGSPLQPSDLAKPRDKERERASGRDSLDRGATLPPAP